MTPKQGRPQKSVSNITIEGLQVQYIVTKRNDWGQEISYFKLLDGFKPRVKPLYKVNKEEGGKLKIPIWESDAKEVNDTKDYMFKVTKKYVNNHEELIEKEYYTLHCDFEYFEIRSDGQWVKGYYAKIWKWEAVRESGSRSGSEDEDL